MSQTSADPGFFDSRKLKVKSGQYVAWIDVMGTASVMERSLSQAANFVFKLHSHWMLHAKDGIDYYPMNDGAYVVANSMEDVKSAMLPVLESLAKAFMSEGEPLHRFMVRGAVAKGHLVHGCDALDCSTILKNNPDCPSRVLLGPVVAQVFHAERNAAPFGVWIDLSAREAKTSSPFWRWWLEKESGFEDGHRAALVTALESHFDWCLCHPAQSQYSKERLDHHRLLAREYFER